MPEPSSQERLIGAAIELASTSGYHGVGINHVLARAGVGNGSLYHSFPEGKAQLVAAAITEESERMAAALTALLADGSERAVRAFFDAAERTLRGDEFRHGCRVTTALADGADVDPLREAGAAVLDRWTDLIAAHLRAEGRRRPQPGRWRTRWSPSTWVRGSRAAPPARPRRCGRVGDAALVLVRDATSASPDRHR